MRSTSSTIVALSNTKALLLSFCIDADAPTRSLNPSTLSFGFNPSKEPVRASTLTGTPVYSTMRSSKKDVSLEKIEISIRPPTRYDVNSTRSTATKVVQYAMARLILIKRMVLKIDQLKLPDPHDSPTFNKIVAYGHTRVLQAKPFLLLSIPVF